MKKYSKYLIAAKHLVLFSASVHILLLIIFAIYKKNIFILNYFDILDIDLFFPEVAIGSTSMIIATAMVLTIYAGIYWFQNKKDF